MFGTTKILSMFAETPVHAGTGTEIGAVDLPHQRERATGIPTIHGSGVKGVLRDAARNFFEDGQQNLVQLLFGSEPPAGPGSAPLEPGALTFSDARLLLFPCRTIGPIFAWVTSPYLLARFQRDAHRTGLCCPDLPSKPSDSEAYVTTTSGYGDLVFVEEFSFTKKEDPTVDKWAQFLRDFVLPGAGDPGYEFWRNHVVKSLVVVSDSNLRDFATYGTEIVTRVRLDREKKTVAEGALWTEEYLPHDTLMYCVVAETLRAQEEGSLLGRLSTLIDAVRVVQFGGKETIGRGFMRLRLV